MMVRLGEFDAAAFARIIREAKPEALLADYRRLVQFVPTTQVAQTQREVLEAEIIRRMTQGPDPQDTTSVVSRPARLGLNPHHPDAPKEN